MGLKSSRSPAYYPRDLTHRERVDIRDRKLTSIPEKYLSQLALSHHHEDDDILRTLI